jgi:DNA-binding response OmpR family regulator
MPELYVLIPDSELRDAAIEQIKAAKLGNPRVIASALAVLKPADDKAPDVLIVDDPGSKNETEELIKVLEEGAGKPIILMLGGAADIPGVTETFSKPFRLGHLMARLKYYLETAPLLRDRIVAFGPYRLEPQNRRVLREKEADPIRLTEKETALLVFLAQNKEPATRQDILANVWGYDERIDTHTLETHIYQLRRKLDKEGECWLINDAGIYRLAEIQE